MTGEATSTTAGASASGAGAAKRRKKQAVVVIHGMGEQRPMSTLRGFVEAVWTRSHYLPQTLQAKLAAPGSLGLERPATYWITPDPLTGSHELRRITTPYDDQNRRTDFLELYWADITQGTTRERLYAWLRSLLWRKRSDIPADVLRLYRATVIFVILLVLAALALAFSFWQRSLDAASVVIILALSSVLFWALDHFVLPYFGDVAILCAGGGRDGREARTGSPAGALPCCAKLLDDKDYDRIVLVSHSLGSMIAYDLLADTVGRAPAAESQTSRPTAQYPSARSMPSQKFAQMPGRPPPSHDKVRPWGVPARHNGGSTRRSERRGWKISDFVTLGQPTARMPSSSALTTWRNGSRASQNAASELCPPLSDRRREAEDRLFQPDLDPKSGRRIRAIHHGAAFAATRWTNIFDIGNLLTTGDPISGSMEENFGPGVEECPCGAVPESPWPLPSAVHAHTLLVASSLRKS